MIQDRNIVEDQCTNINSLILVIVTCCRERTQSLWDSLFRRGLMGAGGQL